MKEKKCLKELKTKNLNAFESFVKAPQNLVDKKTMIQNKGENASAVQQIKKTNR